jgi:hypothetical protein
MKVRKIMLVFILILLTPPQLFASGLCSGRSLGMAQAYTSVARGVESVFWNPANLGFSKTSERNLMLFSLGANAYNNSFNLAQYNRYNGAFLTSEDKQTILDLIPPEGFDLSLNADVLALGLSWGNFAFTFSGKGTSNLSLPKDPIHVLFFGNEINDTIVISGSDGEAFASMEFRFSYGKSIWRKDEKEIFCGINAKYIRGLTYQKVKQAEGKVFALETGVNGKGDFAIQSAEGGKGYGLDFGLTLKYKENWTFGLSFFNLINQIKWNKGTEKRGYRVQIDSLLAEDFDLDSLIMEHSYTENIAPFATQMPITMQVGLAYQIKRTLLAFDLKQGLKNGMGETKKLSASLGADYAFLRWLALRGGISLKEDEGITIANGLGFKLNDYHLDIGIANQKGVWPTKSKGVCLAVSNSFYF